MAFQEKDIQNLIADFLWLLNFDYERVPELANKGQEINISGNRIDLILKDKKTARPVIVEFKAVPFYRENIGQLIEYRAKVAMLLASEIDSQLKEIFGELLMVPILILVVPTCTEEARIACNLSGIEIYTYNKKKSEFRMPETRVRFEEFTREISDENDITFSEERVYKVQKVYSKIGDLLQKLSLNNGWKSYRRPTGEYWDSFSPLFINKSLFSDEVISIGIYEPIFEIKKLNNICIEFFSYNDTKLKKFKEYWVKENLSPNIDDSIDSISLALHKEKIHLSTRNPR